MCIDGFADLVTPTSAVGPRIVVTTVARLLVRFGSDWAPATVARFVTDPAVSAFTVNVIIALPALAKAPKSQ